MINKDAGDTAVMKGDIELMGDPPTRVNSGQRGITKALPAVCMEKSRQVHEKCN